MSAGSDTAAPAPPPDLAPAPAGAGRAARATVRVWDPVVRLFHWSAVALFAAAWLSAGIEDDLHEPAGYALLALVALRAFWGLAGPRPARFARFVPGPRRLARYLAALLGGRAPRHLGHNPAGGAMIAALLLLLAGTCVTGWLMLTPRFFGIQWMEDLHDGLARLTLALVPLHVAGVVLSSLLHRENLVSAMITGRKPAPAPGDVPP